MTAPPLVEELVPAPDPVAACERFLGAPYLLFLDSASAREAPHDPAAARLARYSFLAADPAVVVRGKGAGAERLTTATAEAAALPHHALREIRALLRPHRADPLPGLPPFQGGAAGYIAYDWGAVLERLPAPRYDDLAIPDVVLGLYDWVIAWDHAAGRAWIISTGMPLTGAAARDRAATRLARVRERLGGGASVQLSALGHRPSARAVAESTHPPAAGPRPRAESALAPSFPVAGAAGLRSSFTHDGYLAAVRRVVDYILAGDIFQANLSQRFEAPLDQTPWALYRRLRAINPAPFAAFLDFGGPDVGELAVVSASPERFLGLPDGRHVEARPIKGTRPRGVGPEHDAALGRALRESEKDRAENLMIVDLLRNDLSRVCRAGTVRVPELFALEHYPTVHHLVSTVVGELEAGCDGVDLLEATFPGGSITGAPKVRAMEIIAELEPSRRGVYCGSVGYLSRTGALDTSIVIRTYLARGGRVYFSAGGGVVADSDPEQEYRETLDKARALIRALAPPGVGGDRAAGRREAEAG
ncbi:MAG TPA: aminodeoxychorismate synthase component I [Gemmatimonadaceae bacterium]|nr:aminodeoxychorismate synthase component I [Gemmatimonadaceae bacterium]